MRFNFKLLFVCWLSLLVSTVYPQEPSYETYGSEELSGLTIYDQLMSSNEILYIATSDGVFSYNSIEFKKLNLPKGVKRKSYFDLKENDRNQIFCSNLNGQFFEITNDSLTLFYELPDSLVVSFNAYTIVDNGLIINAKRTLLIGWDRIPIQTLEYPVPFLSSNELVTVKLYENEDSIEYNIYAKNGYDKPHLYRVVFPNEGCIFSLYYHKGIVYCKDKCSDKFIKVDIRNNQWKTFNYSPFIETGMLIDDSTFWGKLSANGIVEFEAEVKDTICYKYYFQDIYAAPQETSKHGIFMGSDGEGVYQIKNKFSHEYPTLKGRKDLLKIIKIPGHNFVIQAKREVLLLSDDFVPKSIFASDANVSFVYYAEDSKKLIIESKTKLYTYSFETGKLRFLTQNPTGVKSLFEVAKDSILYSSPHAIGVFTLDKTSSTKKYLKGVRSSCCLRANNAKDYFGTYQGLLEFEKNRNKFNFITYKGSNVFATKLFEFQDRIIIYSAEHGVLEYKNRTVSPLIIPNVTSKNIRDIYFQSPYLSIDTKKMLVVYNLESNKQLVFAESDGLQSTNIKDVTIESNTLYVLTDKGLQSISLSNIERNELTPQIRMNKVVINDTVILKQRTELNHWENKIAFELLGNAYGKQKNVQYKYQLKGLSNTWNVKEYYDNIIEYQSLPSGRYQLIVIPVYKGKEGKAINYTFIIAPPFWQTWWFYSLLVILGVFSTAFIYRIYSLRKIRKIQLESQINKLRLQAIQSQMNPHFIFNAINAIQDSVLNEDQSVTYQHINKFSKLVRLTLNFSNEELISLQEEIDLLKLYLELEKIRFPDEFDFEIHNSANVYLSISPMLVQPLVENAILHGLFHKKGNKRLVITISENQHLSIIIEDNGIGRVAAYKINQKRKKEYEKSFATGAVNDRLVILKQKHGLDNVGIEFVDLYNENKTPIGTRVILKLPLIQNL
ncbi:MAG: histidine kinase [Flavobacteriales bacterium]|jgi:uncharacterized membrane-anchored protein YhcB (DUF1043 family)|nr:histidine kinase [Flavobacteriales bacterium]